MSLDPIPREDIYSFCPSMQGESAAHTALFYAFNTVINLAVWGPEERAREACGEALVACRRYERLFSRTLPHSDISVLNSAGGKQVAVSDDTYDLLEQSIGFCARSQGYFDITVGSATRLWNFAEGIIPSEEALQEALRHVDYHGIVLSGEPGARKAQLLDPFAAVDVGGTAKGYIADELGKLFRRNGLPSFFVNLGGNVVVGEEKPDGSAFRVGIRNPKDPSGVLSAIELVNGSVVSSGLTERCFYKDGVRYCHILNPQTGMPITTDAESATVVAETSMVCDGLSTTLCALGIRDGLAFAKAQPDVFCALFVDADNELHS